MTVPTHIIETSRTRIYQLRAGDAVDMHRVYGVAGAMPYVDEGKPLDLQTCELWVQKTLQNVLSRGYGMCLCRDRENGEVIGCIGLVHPQHQEVPEIKYALRESYRGRGLATEMVRAMIDYGHRKHGMSRIIATVHPQNDASVHVLSKCGFIECEPRTEDDGTITRVFELLQGEGQRNSTDQ